jgi:hypothetical protein
MITHLLTALRRPFASHPVSLHTPLDVDTCLARFRSHVAVEGSWSGAFSSKPLIGELFRQHTFTLRLNERNTITTFEGSFIPEADGTAITGRVTLLSTALLLVFLPPGFLLLHSLDSWSFRNHWPLMVGMLLFCLLVAMNLVSNRPSDERRILQHVATLFEAQDGEVS